MPGGQKMRQYCQGNGPGYCVHASLTIESEGRTKAALNSAGNEWAWELYSRDRFGESVISFLFLHDLLLPHTHVWCQQWSLLTPAWLCLYSEPSLLRGLTIKNEKVSFYANPVCVRPTIWVLRSKFVLRLHFWLEQMLPYIY